MHCCLFLQLYRQAHVLAKCFLQPAQGLQTTLLLSAVKLMVEFLTWTSAAVWILTQFQNIEQLMQSLKLLNAARNIVPFSLLQIQIKQLVITERILRQKIGNPTISPPTTSIWEVFYSGKAHSLLKHVTKTDSRCVFRGILAHADGQEEQTLRRLTFKCSYKNPISYVS